MNRAALAILLTAACSVHDVEQPFKDVGADLAEVSYCEFEPCGQVFVCDIVIPYAGSLQPEICWVDDSATELESALDQAGHGPASCEPTPRGGQLGWPCLYCCGSTCGRGANAYQGYYCGG